MKLQSHSKNETYRHTTRRMTHDKFKLYHKFTQPELAKSSQSGVCFL